MIWPFKRKPAPAPIKPPLRWHKSDGAFRERSDLVGWCAKMLNSPEGSSLQAYLFAGVPESISFRGDKIEAIQAAQEYFRIVGYLECLNRLQSAAHMLAQPLPEIEADYDQTPPGEKPEE